MKTAPLSCPRHQAPWREAIALAERLSAAGYQSYLVGGCVRDLLLGRAVHDVDIATNAHPDQVERCFAAAGLKTIAVGKAFGVIVVVTPTGAHVEIATFRHDGAYIDGRRPSGVEFSSVEDDVNRRDFTVNALLYDVIDSQVIDYVGGLDDVRERVLRAVGDPARRLAEDRLRVLRGLRFAAQLDLRVEPATWRALASTSLAGLSRERVVQEWFKALAGSACGAWLALLRASGQLAALCPPLADQSDQTLDTLQHGLARLGADDASEVGAAVWLAPLSRAQAAAWLEGLPLAREWVKRVRWLLDQGAEAGRLLALPLAERRRRLRHPGAGQLARFAQIQYPDAAATQELKAAVAAETAAGTWQALIGAEDLIALGCRPGPHLGALLRRLEDAQLDGRIATRAAGLELARSWLEAPPS